MIAPEKILSGLEHAAETTLENMLFTEGDPCDEPFPVAGDGYACAVLDLPGVGALHLRVGSGLLDQFANDVLTPDGELPESARSDVLLEMLNVMAGHFMDRVRGGIFELGLPRLADAAAPALALGRAVDGGRLFLGFANPPGEVT